MSEEHDNPERHVLRALFLDEAEGHLQRMTEAYQALSRTAAAPGFVPGPEVDALFRALHTLKGAAGSVGHDGIAAAAHEIEDLCAEMRSGDLFPTPGILEALHDDVQALRALVEGARLTHVRAPAPAPVVDGAPRVLVDRRKQAERRVVGERRSDDRSVRVESSQLDSLLDSVGDLVILRSRIERRVGELDGLHRDLDNVRTAIRRAVLALGNRPARAAAATQESAPLQRRAVTRLSEMEAELASSLAHLERATLGLVDDSEALRRQGDRLGEIVRQARLQRMDVVFHRLGAALRETAADCGKRVELATSGGELELDKAVLERLYDPLLHLLRNALAHGIEAPDTRRRLGKAEPGRIEISARIEGDFVFISFGDDGQGVDRAAVRAALLRTGAVPPDATLDDETLLSALFEPGFSTRTEADALAGRGIGLDVVKTTLLQLGGDVTCESDLARGTRFRMSFPLVTAITDALLFKVGGQVYAVPAAHVIEALPSPGSGDESAPLFPGHIRLADGSELPMLRLQALLGVEMPPDHRTAALHIRYGDRSFVLTCDRLIGLRTIVVRPLGPLLGSLRPYAGVTISGTGKAQLVLDLGTLADIACSPQRAPFSSPRRGPPRVLVVDDSRLARESASRSLSGEGFQVVAAEDGWEAWELLNERRFDLLVTDLEMPRLDGFQLLTRVRREATLRDLPVVLMTSRTARAVRERAQRLGADLVIGKSPNRRALAQAVRELLAERRRHSDVA